jgi:uncharacterized membrane protein YfcA
MSDGASFSPTTGLLVTASFLAALNAVAGGGSFLSFPAILGAGVLPVPANATNTVALWPGQITSIAAYRDDLSHNLRLLLPVCGCALLGGLGGAIMLLHTGQWTFLRVVPWLLLAAACCLQPASQLAGPSPTAGSMWRSRLICITCRYARLCS